MLYLTISITLLVMIAAMHLLAKARKENLGSMFTWITYIIILIATLVLICQVARGCKRMCSPKEKGMHHMMMRGMCNEEMEGCEGMGGRMEGCESKMKCDEGMKDCKGMKGDDDDADSTEHKGMH